MFNRVSKSRISNAIKKKVGFKKQNEVIKNMKCNLRKKRKSFCGG